MVIKDIEIPEENIRLLIEEQRVGNILYIISDSYFPILDNVCYRISVSRINENDFYNYEEKHGLDLSASGLRSYYIFNTKTRSSHNAKYLENTSYYDEVINAFEELINSGNSEFTPKALEVYKKIKEYDFRIGSGKNAI